jgi:hypothetical protein
MPQVMPHNWRRDLLDREVWRLRLAAADNARPEVLPRLTRLGYIQPKSRAIRPLKT